MQSLIYTLTRTVALGQGSRPSAASGSNIDKKRRYTDSDMAKGRSEV